MYRVQRFKIIYRAKKLKHRFYFSKYTLKKINK